MASGTVWCGPRMGVWQEGHDAELTLFKRVRSENGIREFLVRHISGWWVWSVRDYTRSGPRLVDIGRTLFQESAVEAADAYA